MAKSKATTQFDILPSDGASVPSTHTSRRNFIVNSVVSVASLSAASAVASPSIVPALPQQDPIFARIADHKAAFAALCSILDEQAIAEKDEPYSPGPHVQIDMTEKTIVQWGDRAPVEIPSRAVFATDRGQIDKHIADKMLQLPPDDMIARDALGLRHTELLAEWDQQEASSARPKLKAVLLRVGEAQDVEIQATEALFTTRPTTLAGALALLQYAHDEEERCGAGEFVGRAMDDENAGYGYNALISTMIDILSTMVDGKKL